VDGGKGLKKASTVSRTTHHVIEIQVDGRIPSGQKSGRTFLKARAGLGYNHQQWEEKLGVEKRQRPTGIE